MESGSPISLLWFKLYTNYLTHIGTETLHWTEESKTVFEDTKEILPDPIERAS